MKQIDIEVKGKTYSIPNCWEMLTPDQFVYLSGLLSQFALGKLSFGDVRLRYVIYILDINMALMPKRESDQNLIAQNLYVIMSQISFIFRLQYPPGVWEGLSPETKRIAAHTEPCDLPDSPEVRYLRKQNYQYAIDACFARQLLPSVSVSGNTYHGYTISVFSDMINCSLTARQYIDAVEIMSGLSDHPERMPLLAAILYCPDIYKSDIAMNNASLFSSLSPDVLQAIVLNFQALVLFLFTKTHFSILWQNSDDKQSAPAISVGMADTIYSLSQDGYGNLDEVNAIPLIDYLDILRKKLIDSVCAMHDSEMKITDIATRTGLEIELINKIIRKR